VLKEEKLQQKALETGAHLLKELQSLKEVPPFSHSTVTYHFELWRIWSSSEHLA